MIYYQKPIVMKLRQPNSIQRAWAPQSMLWDFLKDPSQSLSLGSASNKTTWEYGGEAYLVFVPSSPLLFPSLSEPLPETKDLTERNAEKSCSHSKGRREADLWGKILKDRNTHTAWHSNRGEEWGRTFHSQETSGVSQHWGRQREGGRTQVPSF